MGRGGRGEVFAKTSVLIMALRTIGDGRTALNGKYGANVIFEFIFTDILQYCGFDLLLIGRFSRRLVLYSSVVTLSFGDPAHGEM